MADKVLKEAKRLYDLGWAIHWCRPKSKQPLESGWTTGPRKPWDELEASYRVGMNVGVRTGKASRLETGYLCCFDLDVKDPSARDAAYTALRGFIGGAKSPTVLSGSGNGSRHLYGVSREPFKMLTLAKNKQFEICLYSEGRQMVLPPSIHPDTGKIYQWKGDWKEPPQFDPSCLMPVPQKKPDVLDKKTIQDFEVADVELAWLPISDAVKSGIIQGTGVTDRSAFLIPATHALISAGLSANEILTVLTERDYVLGDCAYDHAQTHSRKKAAHWLWKYTVERLMRERDPVLAFKDVPVVRAPELKKEAADAQYEELRDKPEERGYYTNDKKPKPDYDALLKTFEKEHPYKTIADMKAVYLFNGTHYVDATPIELKGYAEKMFKPHPEEKVRNEFYSKILANHIHRRTFFTESVEGCLNFKNGVLNLSQGNTLLPHSPHYGFRGVLPYGFDSQATCPVFKEWLLGVMLGDTELASILQEFMGYILRGGEYKYHKALWLGGVGRNGKSTFVDVLKALIGAGNYSVISIKSLMGDKFAGADLDGKIANFSEETSPKELADSGPFKNLTGNGDLFVQKKYGDPYSLRNKAKLVMTYNQIPDLEDLSKGMLSRPLIIPFEKIIEEENQDREIQKKLLKELPGIFNFALRGWYRLEKQGGFTYSTKSDLALQKVKEESCAVFQWVDNWIEEDTKEGNDYRATQLYNLYCRQEKRPYKFINFCRRLNLHPTMKKVHIRRSDGVHYLNIKMR